MNRTYETKMKKLRKFILPATVTLLFWATSILWISNAEKKNKIEAQKNELAQIKEQLTIQKKLFQADSLLVKGNYQDALTEYQTNDNLVAIEDGDVAVRLRMAIAQRFLDIKNDLEHQQKAQESFMDSVDVKTEEVTSAVEIGQLDSLNFVLSKTKMQLSKLKQQLYQKSFGEYLTFTNAKGSQVHYVGQVEDGKANGYGVAILNTGSRYVGEWNNNQRHGQGAFYWKDGQYYEGNYSFGKRDGQGTYYWPNGEKYVGQWKNDQRSGKGAFYAKDGKLMTSGVWENDKMVTSNDRPKKQKMAKQKDVAAL